MKNILVLAVVILVAGPLGAKEPDTGNEEAIRKLYLSYDNAWSRGDATGVAALWAEDADHMEPDGRVIKGRAAMEKAFANRFATDLKGTQSKQKVESIRFITPEVAVVDAFYEVTGVRGTDGQELPPIQGRYVDIWVHPGGNWRIATSRPIAQFRSSESPTRRK